MPLWAVHREQAVVNGGGDTGKAVTAARSFLDWASNISVKQSNQETVTQVIFPISCLMFI